MSSSRLWGVGPFVLSCLVTPLLVVQSQPVQAQSAATLESTAAATLEPRLEPRLGAVYEAVPAAVRLRTAALLLSDQEGGELVMVASAVRRFDGDLPTAEISVELDGASLRSALPDGGDVEAFLYLIDERGEIYDSATASWRVPGTVKADPDKPSVDPASSETGSSETVDSGASEASEPEPSEPEPDVLPVRLHTALSLPAATRLRGVQLRVRALFRAGESFGLRSIDVQVPGGDDLSPAWLEPRFVHQDPPWLEVAPAGRGLDVSFPALPVLRRGAAVELELASAGKSLQALQGAELELILGDASRRLPVNFAAGAAAEDRARARARIELPQDLEEGRYRAVVHGADAQPSASVEVLILDPGHPPVRWTEMAKLESLETTFTAEALEMPATERQRIDAARKALFEIIVDLERGDAAAGARLRALEKSLHDVLGHDSVSFLEKQLGKVLGQIVKRSRRTPEDVLPLIWLFMEHGARHHREGRYRYYRLSLDMILELSRWAAEKKGEARDGVVDSLVVLAGRMQRRSLMQPAEQLLEEVLGHAPEHPVALSTLAAIYERHGRAEDAARLLRRWSKLEPERPAPWLRLGVAAQRAGDVDEAEESFNKVLELKADEFRGWRALAYHQSFRLAIDRRNKVVAGRILEAGLKDLPDDVPLRVAEAWLAGLKGDEATSRRLADAMPTAVDAENTRHSFHAWPRKDLDRIEQDVRRRVDAVRARTAATARQALENSF